ncbi:ester cyclase [Micromonospora sp. HM134]|uniref:ester cyclase n=1 Tax=unclassified Micromonospora TaxID=2617518 RepID=UPI001198A3EB|nr:MULTISPECIES: ester cyclase [unclassified Micromonospora]QDY10711.1 ester cyclase [Micromonospora sp. HM134]
MIDVEAVARRFVTDVWNAGREESAYELVAEECPGLGGTGPAAVLAWHRERRAAFPDLRYKLVDVVAAGDRVALRWRAAGTQAGQFGPVPPTGQVVSYSGATFLRFDAVGRIVDAWSVNELFQLLQQLGVEMLPPLTDAGA